MFYSIIICRTFVKLLDVSFNQCKVLFSNKINIPNKLVSSINCYKSSISIS